MRLGLRLPALMSACAACALAVIVLLAQAPAGAEVPAPAPAPDPDAPAADTRPPKLTKVVLTPKRTRARSGAALSFRLDEAARVAGEVTLRRRGVRTPGRRCVKRTKRRRGPHCTLRTRAGRVLAANAAGGENRARLKLRRLRRGTYTLTLTPTDLAGNVGASRAVAFVIR